MKIDLNAERSWMDLRVLGGHRAEFEDQARQLRGILNRQDAVIAFGGHFSCGKSTLLSALIERDILPVGDLPETGVPCELRGGPADRVLAVGPGSRTQALPWNSTAIASQIGLYAADGSRRPAADMPDRLDIQVDSQALMPGVVWVDTPGINDDPVVSGRALDVALDADILVWVLSSRQCFSEPEVAFLDQFVEQRGADALAFVLNTFLPADDAASWDRFNAREGPVLRERIAARMSELDVADAPLYVLSARAARAGRDAAGDDFGVAGLHAWLRGMSGRNASAVRNSRGVRIRRRTDVLRDGLAPRLDAARALVSSEQRLAQEHQRAVEVRAACLGEARKFIKDTMTAFGREATAVAERVGARIDADGLVRDSGYGDVLTATLQQVLTPKAHCDRLDLILERHGFGRLGRGRRSRIAAALAGQPLKVTVPDTPIKAATVGTTAVAVGVLGALFTAGASLLVTGAALGAGAVKGANDAHKADVAGTKANLRAAAAGEHRRLTQAGRIVLEIVEDALGPVPVAIAGQGGSQLAALMALDEHYRLLAGSHG